jgi:hypothetical protein
LTYTISGFSLWIVAGQSISGIPGFLRGSLEIVSGYVSMSRGSPTTTQLVVMLVAMAFHSHIRQSFGMARLVGSRADGPNSGLAVVGFKARSSLIIMWSIGDRGGSAFWRQCWFGSRAQAIPDTLGGDRIVCPIVRLRELLRSWRIVAGISMRSLAHTGIRASSTDGHRHSGFARLNDRWETISQLA